MSQALFTLATFCILLYNMVMKVKVFAKINLSLNVVGVMEGYHLLDALTTSVDLFDQVEVSLRHDGNVNVYGMDIPMQSNVAYKAAQRFFAEFGGSGCDVTITKGIPFSQGVGGSSADASATIYCLAKLTGVDLHHPKIKSVCDAVGSDVFFMLHGGLGLITNRSDVQHLDYVPCYLCLTTFCHQSDTAKVFSAYDKLSNGSCVNNAKVVDALKNGCWEVANSLCFNALQQANASLSNYANEYLSFCNANGLKTTMTGSGSAYFILCNSHQHAKNLADSLQEAGFFTVVCQTQPVGIVEQ